MIPTKVLSLTRIAAINQFQGVIENLSRQGLRDLLTKSYLIEIQGHEPSRKDLIQAILVKEYGREDMEAFDANL